MATAQDRNTVVLRQDSGKLAGVLAAILDSRAELDRWLAAIAAGGRVDVCLHQAAPLPDDLPQQRGSHVPSLGARIRIGKIDKINFCLIAAEAGLDWRQAALTYTWLLRSNVVLASDEPCDLGRRGCVMKPSNARVNEPHRLISIPVLLGLTKQRVTDEGAHIRGLRFTQRMLEILAAVQERLRLEGR